MDVSTTGLILAPGAAIDLQLHTTYSDGSWLPEELLDHLKGEQFGLAAITDHDRVDSIPLVQQLAIEKQMPVLVAVEMTTTWRSGTGITDILCYGLDPEPDALDALAQDVQRRQQDNTREVYENLRRKGYGDGSSQPDELAAMLAKPGAQHLNDLIAFLARNGCDSLGRPLLEAGFVLETNDTAAVVDAAHRSGAVCLIAHPGRTDGFVTYDSDLLDQFRREIPIDGLEVYYPAHTPEQIALYRDYAQQHDLLTSSGSDSHGPDKKPVKYRAELSRKLLERAGIQIK